MGTPFVYIIMPCYNSEKYLLEQLMSIYYQNYKNWYLIFVNDWSTDDSENIARKFVSHYNLFHKVKIIRKENGWVTTAVQRWLEEVKSLCDIYNTNYLIAFCDSDDIRTRDKLFVQVEYMQKHADCWLLYHDLSVIDENWILIKPSQLKTAYNKDLTFFHWATIWNYITSTEMMFRPKYIDFIIPMPVWFWIYQDFRSLLVMSLLDAKIDYLNIPLAYYRSWHDSLRKKQNNAKLKYKMRAKLKYFEELQRRFPKKNLSYFLNYNYDRFIYWPEKWYSPIMIYFCIMIKYPKVFFKWLKIIIYKLLVFRTIR